MRVIFFGTPLFAEEVLKELLDKGIDIVAVVTKPDKPQKRSSTPLPPDVKNFIIQNYPSIPLFQPLKASTPEFAEILSGFNPDLFVVVAYSEIIKRNLLEMPKKGCINVHGSILPKYRGAAPIQRSIIAGEKETGVSIIEMVREMDAGPVLAVDSIPIEQDDTYGTLSTKLSHLGSKLLLRIIKEIENGTVLKQEQDHSQATFAPKMTTDDGELNWKEPVLNVYNRFRGVTPKPGAWCKIKIKEEVKRLRILKSKLYSGDLPLLEVGSFLSTNEGPIIKCLNGGLVLLEVQLEGKKAMSGADFLRGSQNIHF